MKLNIEVIAGANGYPEVLINGKEFMQTFEDKFFILGNKIKDVVNCADGGINGRVKQDQPKVQTRSVIVRSRSNPDVRYRLTVADDKAIACTCNGFNYRGMCKHIEEFNRSKGF